jgi:hypothetical protein
VTVADVTGRTIYFLRRSLVTLDEFCGALNRLNEIKEWRHNVEKTDEPQRRKMWTRAGAPNRPVSSV